jgi:hypothetical protein
MAPSVIAQCFDTLAYPKVNKVDFKVKDAKARKMLSNMKGNRFAKPPPGVSGRGGNTRDKNKKSSYLMREMTEAAACGIDRDEFLSMLKDANLLITRKFVDGVRVIDDSEDFESVKATTVSRSVQTSNKTSEGSYKVEDIDDEATEFDPHA